MSAPVGMSDLPVEVLAHTLGYLTPKQQGTVAQLVCRTWYDTIQNIVWVNQSLCGDVRIAKESLILHTQSRPYKWEKEESELYVRQWVDSEDSLQECKDKHGWPKCRNGGCAGSWQDKYSKMPDSYFPSFLPLRLFINQDGSFKNNGDKLYLIYNKKFAVLTCYYEPEFSSETMNPLYPDFASGLLHRIEISKTAGFVTQEDVDAVISSAQQQKNQWIRSGDREQLKKV